MKSSNKNRLHNIIKIIILFIIFLTIVYIIFNSSTIKIVSKFIELQNLKSNIKIEQEANQNYKERLYLLKNNPKYLEQIVKAELDVIDKDEIEYRFED